MATEPGKQSTQVHAVYADTERVLFGDERGYGNFPSPSRPYSALAMGQQDMLALLQLVCVFFSHGTCASSYCSHFPLQPGYTQT